MIYRDGVFSTRPVLSATEEDAFDDENLHSFMDSEVLVTNTQVSVDGKQMKVLYIKETDYISQNILHVYFLAPDGTRIAAGRMVFSRVDSTTFYQPANVLFFSGAPISGNGVYAMITRENVYNTEEKTYEIFENSSDMQSWSRVTSYYVPTVLINGRGSQYEYAYSLGFAYTGTPTVLESKNLLNGSFAAYYTSDRYSSSFRLPFPNLTDCRITCRVYAASDVYTDWIIEPEENSTTATFFSTQIRLTINRTTGIISFFDASGMDYAFERFGKYHENNIRVTASQFCEEDFEDIVSCTCCADCGSQLVFSGGKKPDRLYSVRKDNPLYFSKGSSASIGTNSNIVAICPLKNGVLALEEDKVTAIHITPGRPFNLHALLADDSTCFYKSDSFSFQTVTTSGGCIGQNGIILIGKTPLWLGTDRKVHVYSESGMREYEISDQITRVLKEIPEYEYDICKMVTNGEDVLFMFPYTTLLLQYRDSASRTDKKAAWYLLDFGNIQLKGGVGGNGILRLVCRYTGSTLFYSAVLASGQADTVIDYEDQLLAERYEKVLSAFSTKAYDFEKPQIRKFIDGIHFSAFCEGVLSVAFNGKPLERLRLRSRCFGTGLKSVRIHPKSGPVLNAKLHFSSDAPFSISDIMFTYRQEG